MLRRPQPSLLARVALSLAAVGLLPLAISSFGLVDLNREALYEQVLRTHIVAAETAAARVSAFLSTRISLARGAAANPALSDPRSPEARSFLAENLGAWSDLGVLAVEVADPAGGKVIQANLRGPGVPERVAAALAPRAGPPGAAVVAVPGADAVRVTAPLPQGAGLLRLVCDGSLLREAVSAAGLGGEADLLVADRRGRIVAGTAASLAGFPEQLVRSALPGRLEGAGRFQEGDREVLGAYSPIPESDWVVISRQPARVAEAVAVRLQRRSAVAIGAALLLIGALSLAAYGSLVRPIRRMVEEQRRLARLPAVPRSGDEIQDLRLAFEALERSLSDRRSLDNVFLGRYQVIEPLGTGAMGSVFRGLDPKLQRPVALKTVRLDADMDPDRRRQLVDTLLREAVTLARLSHPNVVPVYDVEDSPEGAFVAMGLVEGGNLSDLLHRRGRLDPSQAVPLGAAIARALEAAHGQEIVHRDIKPANVLLGWDGSIKVSDFGIAELLATTSAERSRMIVGTPGYVPPETLDGGVYGKPNDLFALGVVLYLCLRGVHPFTAETLPEIVRATLTRPVQPLSRTVAGIPRALEDLVHRLLERNPDARPGSAGAVAAELEALANAYGYRWSLGVGPGELGPEAAPLTHWSPMSTAPLTRWRR